MLDLNRQMNFRRVATIAIATTLALLSTVSAQPLAARPAATHQNTTDGRNNSSADAGTAPTVGLDDAAVSGVDKLLPIPPPVDGEIAAVLENERRAVAVEEAKAAAAAEAAAADAIVASAQGVVDQAHLVIADAARVVQDKQAKLTNVRGMLDQTNAIMDAKAQQAINVGVSMYTETGGERDPRMAVAMAVFAGGKGIPDASAAKVYRDALAEKAFGDLVQARKASARAKVRVRKAEGVLKTAQGELDGANRAARQSEAQLTEARRQAENTRSTGAKQVAAAEAEAPSLKSTELTGGLAILGDPLVSAKDLAAFVKRHGKAHPSIDLEKLAEIYIAEGKAEGVRSDVAWVQSIIETGWFSFGGSMVRADDYNYAGIGACDSCSRGIIFKSMSDGVRTQVQLLRTYATKRLTTEDLANPPPRLVPEKSSVRGCCATWMGLSGVWATGPGYGIKILTLYNQLLSFAAAQRLK